MHYLNTWNIFSKSLLIKENLKNSIIITKWENIKKYLTIFEFLQTPIIEINDLSQFIDCVKNDTWNFILNYDFFYTKSQNLWQIENQFIINLEKNQFIEPQEFLKKLNDFWYIHSDFLEWWTYKKMWDTIQIKQKNKSETIIISFFWDIIENIFIEKWVNSKDVDKITFWKIQDINFFDLEDDFQIQLAELINKKHIILDNIDIFSWAENLLSLNYIISLDLLKSAKFEQVNLDRSDIFIDSLELLIKKLKESKEKIIYSKNQNTIQSFLEYNSILNVKVIPTKLTLLKSFQTEKQIVICDDILSKIFVKKRIKKSLSENIDLLLQIKNGDYVVHRDHGIGIFEWIITKEIWKLKREYLEISYKNNDKLFVPITETIRVSKYIWNENPNLTWLSTKEWSKKLEKVSQDVQKVAMELLEIYAKRKILEWFSFEYKKNLMDEFERSFDYEYTSDQKNAIDEIMEDMQEKIPMERVLVWDVWFWKTEIAFNAIYNAFLNGKQSILISPLVVLAYEHYQKACERFSSFPLQIELLTRFQTNSQVKIILEKLKKWQIDLIIWTHRLLSESIEYKDLWLLIVDEEHKFWVQDKERLKEFKSNIDILSMSATPIPRSLNMALSWIKSVSILSNPPLMRKWVETFVSKFDDNIIFQAWKKEFERWGQLFFIHNRVENIEQMQKYLLTLFPNKKVIITHWQLPWRELEERILDFKQRKYDILLSSTVIENWIDFSNVNTIIINDAYRFGISQIYQLRWRVWRWDKIWYCYLLFKQDKLKEDAAKRLTTMVEYSHLWAWFELSMRDLEIRGWGDILWIKQSWISSEVWINTYLKMLEEKVEELKMNFIPNRENLEDKDKLKNIWKKIETSIDLNISAFLEDDFFSWDLDKLNFYREIESISSIEDLESLKEDFSNYSQSMSKETSNLFKILEVKLTSWKYKIKSIKRSWVSYEITFDSSIIVEDFKKFLDLDTKVKFIVQSLTNLKTPCRNFNSDEDFLNYLYEIMISPKKKKIKSINLKK